MQCQKKKQSGTRCRGRALTGKKYCLIHSEPSKAAELGRKGGRRRTVYSPDGLREFAAPKNLAELMDLMAQSMADVRMGRMDPRIGTALAYMLVAYLKAMEVSEEKKPPVYPDIYRGLTVVKRVVRTESEEQSVHNEERPPAAPVIGVDAEMKERMAKEVEIAPGVFRY